MLKSFLLLIFFVTLFWGCNPHKIKNSIAHKGVIDLKSIDFSDSKIIKLNGEWEFYWQRFFEPEEFRSDTIKPDLYTSLPNYWNGEIVNGKKLPGNGFATYRLKILKSAKKEQLALKLHTVSTAYSLYINGKKLTSNGIIGKNSSSSIPAYSPHIIVFDADTSQLEIVMQISNFHHRLGGPWETMELGSAKAIINLKYQNLGIELFLVGSILIMAFYHLGLFFIRRRDKSPFWFGLFCLLIVLRVSVTGEYPINIWLSAYWNVLIFVEYLSLYLAVPVFLHFVNSLFKSKITQNFAILVDIWSLLLTGLVVFTSVNTYSKSVDYFKIGLLVAGFYCFFAILRAYISKIKGAGVFLIGFLLLFSTVINDILYQSSIIQTTNLVPFGLFLFIFSQAFLLSSRFSKAFDQTEKLTAQLNSINKNLENIVAERTNEINMQKEELVAQSEYLEEANIEITKQKHEIEITHKNIIDSIQYASKIQNAVLPHSEIITSLLPNHFILFKPRDVVSGDFYFIKQVKNKIYVAVADCTGHGVPGAFMSMLGIALLNDIIQNKEINSVDLILNELRTQIKYALQQTGKTKERKEGIEIAFCSIDIQTKQLNFAGAKRPLWLYRNNNLIEYKGDRIPVGVYPRERNFTNQTIQLQTNDMIYLFSDGFSSQFGGKKGSTFKTSQLKQLLLQIHLNSMENQKEILEQTFSDWKENQGQIDDVLVMGIRI